MTLTIVSMRTDAVSAAVKGDGWMVCGGCDGHCQRYEVVGYEGAWIPCDACHGHGRIRVHYVGRAMPGAKGSPLGNPYKPGRDGTVEECLKKYELMLMAITIAEGTVIERALLGDWRPKLAALDAIVADLRAGYAVALACWCCTGTVEECDGKCHAAVVARVVRERMEV